MDVYIRNNVYNILEEEDFITCIETINTVKTHNIYMYWKLLIHLPGNTSYQYLWNLLKLDFFLEN